MLVTNRRRRFHQGRYFVTNLYCFIKPFYDHGDSDVGDIMMLVT